MASYLSSIASLPKPTCEQTFRFAWFVAHAHSWYKHLPQRSKVPFVFFLDPNAGKNLIVTPAGEQAMLEVTAESRHFHYTWQTTNDYRRRFGHWNYFAPYGNTFQYWDQADVVETARTATQILDDSGDWTSVPDHDCKLGTAKINAFVHSEFELGMPDRADGAMRARTYFVEAMQAAIMPILRREALLHDPGELSPISDRASAIAEGWFQSIPPADPWQLNPFLDRFDEIREPEMRLLRFSDAEMESAFALLQWRLIARHRRVTSMDEHSKTNVLLALEQHHQLLEMYRAMTRFLAETNTQS